MFSKLVIIASLAAILAAATPTRRNTGPTDACCTSMTTAGDPSEASLFQSLGIDISDVNVPIGLGCSPITAVGVSGTSCTNDPVSCDQVFTSSLVGLNCDPIDISG